MRDYLRASDLTHLPQDAIALYDDDTAQGDRLLHFGDRLLLDKQTGVGEGCKPKEKTPAVGKKATVKNGKKRKHSEMVALPR